MIMIYGCSVAFGDKEAFPFLILMAN